MHQVIAKVLAITGMVALSVLSAASIFAQTVAFTGSLSGAVLTDSTDAPIANAEIRFTNLKLSARSDAKGNFQITGVPAGVHELIVRVVGFQPYSTTVTFRGAQKVEADFLLKPIVTRLTNVNVKAAADARYAARLTDFEARRRSTPGRFLTADVFEKAVGQNMSRLLISQIPGLRTAGKSTDQVLMASRGAKSCAVQVVVNGMSQFNGRPGESLMDIDSFYTGEVIGLEFYNVSSTPAQFGTTGGKTGGSQCGTVVIWTK